MSLRPTTATILHAAGAGRACLLAAAAAGLVFVLIVAAPSADAGDAGSGPVDFRRQIRPLLSDRCFACHGPDERHREADLRLDREEDAKRDRDGRRAVAPGKPGESELVRRITSPDAETRMPPASSGKSLAAGEIALLSRWIEEGAAWSKHWAYVPPGRRAPPAVRDEAWPQGWIDRFLLARLEAEGLGPSSEADPATLVRRLSFDLLGLPPSPTDVDGYAADPTPAAWERLVDRLLASERHGERMAMYWLDLVRFADTVGYHGDQDHSISPYRDWVMDAFNDNLPFDRFTREQLAGDLVPGAGVDGKIASGYNRLLQTSHEGGVQPKEYLTIYAADRVRSVSGVWMGATIGCCQCHDHKYDPFTTRDFYSLAAFFADVDEAEHFTRGTNALPTARPPEMTVLTQRERHAYEAVEEELRAREAELAAAGGPAAAGGGSGDGSAGGNGSAGGDGGEARARLAAEVAALAARREEIRKAARPTMVTEAIAPRTVRILPRGNWLDDSGEVVEPAVPAVLGHLEGRGGRATRLDLADWLVDAERGAGGLTARVLANRLWYLFFGTGIARNLDDFGGQGEPPVHAELLDNLALELVESGWDVKRLVRRLVTSRAYRQSSLAPPGLRERDPYNGLFARQSRFRLPAEMVRDAALAAGGLLVLEYGGASVKPYQPAGYYKHLNFPTREYQHDTGGRQWRRGVYVHWQRQFLHPMLRAFDAPRREECTAERPRSNTPLAAMVLLNDPTFVEAARVFAERLLREGGATAEARVELAFRLAVSRRPDAEERRLLLELLGSSRERYDAEPQAAAAVRGAGQAPSPPDLDPRELAAWTAVARAILNLNETFTRN